MTSLTTFYHTLNFYITVNSNFWNKSSYFRQSPLDSFLFQFLTTPIRPFLALSTILCLPQSTLDTLIIPPGQKAMFQPRAFALALLSTPHGLSLNICMAHSLSLFQSFIKCHLCREVFHCYYAISPYIYFLYNVYQDLTL